MLENWQNNIEENQGLVARSAGPSIVTVVSGSREDKAFWQQVIDRSRRDTFRQDGETFVVAVSEEVRKGNFLGTFNAWKETRQAAEAAGRSLPEVGLMTMVFGKGTRLSPFTQMLGNRKPAFPIPIHSSTSEFYLSTADLSNLYANLWVKHLSDGGFRGIVVKWGDEAIIPGLLWSQSVTDYRNVDAFRMVWKTEPTETLAREKDWVLIDSSTGLMKYQFARQGMDGLKARLAEYEPGSFQTGVNLGSLAISYDFLAVAQDILKEDLLSPKKWVDWDPYAWMALTCSSEEEWRREADREAQAGRKGIRELEERFPGFYARMAEVRQALENRTGRPLAVGVLDYGDAFWTDIGLHVTLRQCMEALTEDTPRGMATRDLFCIPHEKDERGNILLGSHIPEGADIQNSVILDSIILDPATVIHNGVVVGGRHRRLNMGEGGVALLCGADAMNYQGPHAVAVKSLGKEVNLPAGGRHTTLFIPGDPTDMITNESIVDYSGDNYSRPILGNPLSFEEAGELMAHLYNPELEYRWLDTWKHWLDKGG